MNSNKLSLLLCNINRFKRKNLSRFFATTTITKSDNVQSTENVDFSSCAATRSFKNDGEEFRYLLRNSPFINLGDPENKVVHGKVFHIVNDDLYIDFGWKFHCVCPRPARNKELYVRGTEVLLRIKQLELTSKFLGSEKGLTLLEADCSIIKLISTPVKHKGNEDPEI